MTTKIKWRLANRPTPSEVQDLFTTGILTKDEAREILFSLETDEDRDKQSLQDEIKFLRSLVESMAKQAKVVEHIKYVDLPYQQKPWFQPYVAYCANYGSAVAGGSYTNGLTASTTNAVYTSTDAVLMSFTSGTTEPSFSDIKTF